MDISPTAIGAVVGGIATAVLAAIAVHQHMNERWRRTRPRNLFFSIQMNDLSEEEYQRVRESILEVVESAKALKRIGRVYYFNRDVTSHDKLDKRHFPIDEYMHELDACDYFIAIISKRVHSSIYFEAGYALAKGKECILFAASQEDVLPTITKCCSDTYPNCKTVPFSDLNEVIYKLRQMTPHLK